MIRVASLYLPQLPIERLRRAERPAAPLEGSVVGPRFQPAIDAEPGGWRPGARWARARVHERASQQSAIDALPAHQRPAMRELGRRSEAADNPFKAMPPDDGAPGTAAPSWPTPWGRPTILIERVGQREVVASACPLGLEQGLRLGMAAAHARALVAELDVRDAEPENDRAFLDRLALHAAAHWTPNASVAAPDGLWLDLSGTTHLFGGEPRFCRRLLAFLRRLGFTARIAIAGTPGAAHALARYRDEAVTILAPGTEAQAIAHLPLAALRLTPEALNAAARFGLERVADLYAMPRGPLARRLGLATVERLDQARGSVAEPIVPVVAFVAPRVQRRLLEPIITADAINQVIGDLVNDLVRVLQAGALGLRNAVLSCAIVDGGEQRIAIGAARATRDARHLVRMLAMRVERIDPGLGIEVMTLTAPRVEALAPEALHAAFGEQPRAPDIAPLVDQLGGRVGEDALFRVGAVESDVPERGCCRLDPLATPAGWPPWRRPVRLLPRPEPLRNVVALLPDHPPRRFSWRGSTYGVIAGDGPERIHGEWWRHSREMWAVRDYFRVEAQDGKRFWIFRRGDGVEAPTGDLSWYMHGMFG